MYAEPSEYDRDDVEGEPIEYMGDRDNTTPYDPDFPYSRYVLMPPKENPDPDSLDESIHRVDRLFESLCFELDHLACWASMDDSVPSGPFINGWKDRAEMLVLARSMGVDREGWLYYRANTRALFRVMLEALAPVIREWNRGEEDDDDDDDDWPRPTLPRDGLGAKRDPLPTLAT